MTEIEDPRHLGGVPIFVRANLGFPMVNAPLTMVNAPMGGRRAAPDAPLDRLQGPWTAPTHARRVKLAQRPARRHLHAIAGSP